MAQNLQKKGPEGHLKRSKEWPPKESQGPAPRSLDAMSETSSRSACALPKARILLMVEILLEKDLKSQKYRIAGSIVQYL